MPASGAESLQVVGVLNLRAAECWLHLCDWTILCKRRLKTGINQRGIGESGQPLCAAEHGLLLCRGAVADPLPALRGGTTPWRDGPGGGHL
jgi:hypothetical protein